MELYISGVHNVSLIESSKMLYIHVLRLLCRVSVYLLYARYADVRRRNRSRNMYLQSVVLSNQDCKLFMVMNYL